MMVPVVVIVLFSRPGILGVLACGRGEEILLELALPYHVDDHIPKMPTTLDVVATIFVAFTQLVHPLIRLVDALGRPLRDPVLFVQLREDVSPGVTKQMVGVGNLGDGEVAI